MDVTFLFVPGDRPERFAKALASGADCVILDLEDAVRPDAKQSARDAILRAELDWDRVAIRINDAASPCFSDDLAWLAWTRAGAIVVPKTENPDTLDRVRLAVGRPVELIPQIETARGLDRTKALLSVPGATRAAFGHLDFALDLGIATDWDALAYFRSRLVMQSRLAGALPPIDSVTVDLKDTDLLEREATDARRFGLGGKLLIHPAQVGPVARAFAPTSDEVEWARRVIAAIEAGGSGALSLDGKMIDKPVEDAARRILARAGDRG
ncbi:HpcH/HpaI aldolase/citrate lyase family protein [Palleronia pelagia]|uniref:Citrate lyase subunit beta / citryl-CoA lyase n=1 Tax=Palleronia pelagia TaxID=387096 RepID=A0A1H8LM67_9RHOB|nr:CoA ester lyase [Palleronia pelagia]SEO06250.1 citrate lyase subunit beta / citryl-CoA lyase [Palleronia pelagia]